VATQKYIPLSEMRVLVIFIEPEGKNVCLKEKTDIRLQNMRLQTLHAAAFPCEITTLQVSFDTILPSVIHML
jgi:hypothetical protein